MAVECPACGIELPFEPGPFTTCPACAPDTDAAGRITGRLVQEALARSGPEALSLLSIAEAWRVMARPRATADR